MFTLRRHAARARWAAALAVAALFAFGSRDGVAQTPPIRTSGPLPAAATAGPYVIDYYYKARWGFAEEFLRLFRKNHLPLLQRRMRAGEIVGLAISAPRYHGTEDGRWDYRVTITFRDVATAHQSSPVPQGRELTELFPDTATFRREEQRRFEILVAHWDLPLVFVPLAP